MRINLDTAGSSTSESRRRDRDRIKTGKRDPYPTTRDPRVADKSRHRWASRERAMKAAAEGRQVTKREGALRFTSKRDRRHARARAALTS